MSATERAATKCKHFRQTCGIKPRHQQEAGEADRTMLSAEWSPSQSQKLSKAEPSLAASICHARHGELICFADFHLTFRESVESHGELHEGDRAPRTIIMLVER